MKRLRTRLRQIFILLIVLWPKWNTDILLVTFSLGAGLVVIGQILHFISAGYLVKKDELITAGPYRFTRNPFYLANFISDIGLVVTAWVPWPALIYLIIFYLIVIPWRIRKEEKFLGAKFRTDYLEYCRRVPAFLPRPWPARLDKGNGCFAWSQIIKYRELWRVIRAFGLIIVLYLQYTIRFNLCEPSTDWSFLLQNLANIVLISILALIIIVPPVIQFGILDRKDQK